MYFISIGFWQLLLILIATLLPLMALIDLIRSNFKVLDKVVWLFMIIFLNFIGAILYYLIGRSQKLPKEYLVGSYGKNN